MKETRNNDALRKAVDGVTEANIQLRVIIEVMRERALSNRITKRS